MTNNLIYQEIGKRIRELRGNDRQKDWATKIGCDQGYISQVENGVTKPSLAFLKSVSGMTNSSIDWILTGRGDKWCGFKSYSAPSGDDTIQQLKDNPKLLLAVDKLLRMKGTGMGVLEAFYDMDEMKIAGLAEFIGAK
ncbi:MAG: helix-turn-helix domain-containing protein [Nitrospirota bacterium]